MTDIDYIMKLIDWNNSVEEQEKGIKMAESIENLNVFLPPSNENYSKNVWDNCAKILSKRTNEELYPYLDNLFRWLQDFNWPGVMTIVEIIERLPKNIIVENLEKSIELALEEKDDIWLDWLYIFIYHNIVDLSDFNKKELFHILNAHSDNFI